jgi:hypothetical protein
VWKALWGLKVPAKIKIHCWRVLLGAIPCNGVLANRHMQPSSECTLCRTDCESARNALFRCPRVNEIWGILGLHGTLAQVCTLEADGGEILETHYVINQQRIPSFLRWIEMTWLRLLSGTYGGKDDNQRMERWSKLLVDRPKQYLHWP